MDLSRVSTLESQPIEPTPAAATDRIGVRPDQDEAAALYEAWSPRVRAYVAFRVREAADVEDIVGEVFRRVVSGPLPAEPDARPAWIFRVAHNAVVDHYRRRRFQILPPDIGDRPDDAPSLPDRVIRDERVRATDEAMRRLPGRQRSAIYLRFYEDLPYETVGAAMGIPAATARSLVFRGLKALAITLGEESDR